MSNTIYTKKCTSKTHIGDKLLPYTEFYKNKRTSDGYHYSCRNCCSIASKKNYTKNPTTKIDAVLKWQKDNKEKSNKNTRKYCKNNPEKRRETQKRWRNNNKGLICFYANKRRAQKTLATPMWFEYVEIKSMYENKTSEQEIHHIVPLQDSKLVCGLHCKDNLIVLPKKVHKQLHSNKQTFIESWQWNITKFQEIC